MATKQIYHYDESLREHPTQIIAVRPFSVLSPDEQALFKSGSESTIVVETAETVFYAQGGGQPFDTGNMTSAGGSSSGEKDTIFEVEGVRMGSGGRILHFGHFTNDARFEEGERVAQRIDGLRRDLLSRIHTAGHLVGLAVRRLAAESAPELKMEDLKAQHYPESAWVEFKGIIESKWKDAIQAQTQKMVEERLPIRLDWYKPEELEREKVILSPEMPVIAGPDGMVRVVDIVGAGSEGLRGAYPCGGTHVQHTGLIGEVRVRNIKRQKGVSKVSYEIVDRKEG